MSIISKLKNIIKGNKENKESKVIIKEVTNSNDKNNSKNNIKKENSNNNFENRRNNKNNKNSNQNNKFENRSRNKNSRKDSNGNIRKDKDGIVEVRQETGSLIPREEIDIQEKSKNRKRRNKNKKNRKREFVDLNVFDVEANYESFGDWSIDEFQVPVEEGKSRFHDYELSPRLMKGIFENGYQYCTPIQGLILPEAVKGKDISGRAQTGTGKTAAFLVTTFKRLQDNTKVDRKKGYPRALILAPTRELVIQIEKDAKNIGKYCGLNIQSVYGGINYEKQKRQIQDKILDILVATPGRLLDYKEQGVLHLEETEILVIDEADRMLDMGFIPDMKKIISSIPKKTERQTLLFSATLNKDILRLAAQWTHNPLSFEVKAKEVTSENIEQIAYIATNKEKFPIMYNIIANDLLSRIIVFGNRKDEVAQLTDLFKACGMSCGLLSGDVSQRKRISTLEDLRSGKIRILCATDVAARGIHVDGITHVFNHSLPDDPEDYVHRIGRTGRAGEKGRSVVFATEEDSYIIPKIEGYTKRKLTYINPEEELVTLPDDLSNLMKMYKFKTRDRVRNIRSDKNRDKSRDKKNFKRSQGKKTSGNSGNRFSNNKDRNSKFNNRFNKKKTSKID